MADHIYLKPLTTKSIIEILKAHPQIDAVLPTGRTNRFELVFRSRKRIWQDFGRMIGVDVNAINITENREQFKQLLKKWVPSAPAEICTSYLRGKEMHKNLVSFSDTSFLYFRRYRAAIVYKKKILMCF
jgi:carbamoyl-phosphate synthase large subunit